jgi:hypothetical protein
MINGILIYFYLKTTTTLGVKTKTCLLRSMESLCDNNQGLVSISCCYTSLCNNGITINMSPFQLILVLASYFVYAKFA